MPRYPIYVPSKGRHDRCLTAKVLIRDEVPFRLVVEPQERDAYAGMYGEDRIIVLPFRDAGSVIPARNWIKDHATKEGHKRHWQIDDNIALFYRMFRKKRIPCRAGIALAMVEDFVDRYENVAIAGLNYTAFTVRKINPFYLNVHVYSCTLVLNSIPNRWRGRYNEDTDICLQVLADGWCTVLFNAFSAHKMPTMTMKGGNTAALYQGDGRLKMARALERLWPGVVRVGRRFKRPQHIVYDAWNRFDTPLVRRKDVDFDNLRPDEHGMVLKQVRPEIKSETIRGMYESYSRRNDSQLPENRRRSKTDGRGG
jgi:hypothetical protein